MKTINCVPKKTPWHYIQYGLKYRLHKHQNQKKYFISFCCVKLTHLVYIYTIKHQIWIYILFFSKILFYSVIHVNNNTFPIRISRALIQFPYLLSFRSNLPHSLVPNYRCIKNLRLHTFQSFIHSKKIIYNLT